MSIRNVQRRLRDGVWWVIGGRILGIGVTFLLNAILARILGPSGFGGFVLAATLIAVFSLIGMIGFNEAFVRFISERLAHNNARGAAGLVLKGLAIASVWLAIGAPIAWLAITQIELGLGAVGDLRTLAVLIVAGAVALAFQQLGAESLRGFHQLRLASIFAGGQTGGLLSSVLLLGLVIASSLAGGPTLTSVLGWFLLALLITLPLTYGALWWTARSAIRGQGPARRELHVPPSRQMLSVGGSIMVIHTLAFVTQQADLWIAGAYCTPEEVGVYGSARRLTLLAAMPVQIATLAVISSIADLHVRGKRRDLQALLRGTATLAAIPAILALLPIMMFPGDILALVFGEAYRDAQFLLVILAIGYLPLILCGNPVHALTMTSRHGIAMAVNLVTTCALLGLGPVAVRLYGVEGLAWVASATFAVQNLVLWLIARIRCGFWTHVGSPAVIVRWPRREQALEPAGASFSGSDNGRVPAGAGWSNLTRDGAASPRGAGSAALLPCYDRRRANFWWLNPEIVFSLVVGGTALIAAWLPAEAYRVYGTPKYFTGHYLMLSCLAIVAFAIGSWVARASRYIPATAPNHVEARLGRWFLAAGTLAMLGYLVWYALAVKNGLSLASLGRFTRLTDAAAADELKQSAMQTLPGITTATQFGIAAFLLGAWLWSRGQRWVMPVLGVLAAATLFRVVLNSERLALLEVAIPATLVVARVLVMERAWGPSARRLITLAPALAVAAVLVVFGATEYPRSWRYYQSEFNSFTEFTLWRITGYYTTALNNGAMMYESHGSWPLPYASLHALWAFPLVEQSPLSYDMLTGMDPEGVTIETLERFGSRELNNTSGLLQPLLDFGPVGFVLFWLAYGGLAGVLYRGFLVGSLAGMAFYPILFLSLLEVPRIFYLTSGRAVTAVAFLALFVLANRTLVVNRAARPEGAQPYAAPALGGGR